MGHPSKLSTRRLAMLTISRGSVITKVFFRSSSRNLEQLLSSTGTSRSGLSLSQSYYRLESSPIWADSFTMLLKERSRRIKFFITKTSGSTWSRFICDKWRALDRCAYVILVLISLCCPFDLLVARSLFGRKSAEIIL